MSRLLFVRERHASKKRSLFSVGHSRGVPQPCRFCKERGLTSLRSFAVSAPLRFLYPPFRSTFKGAIIATEVDMFDIKKDIQAMTTFRRNPGEFMKRLKKTKRPLILTVNGKAEAVVQDAEAYQRLLDIAAQADAGEGIRQGLEDVKKGRVRPAREALEVFRRVHEIPR